MKKLVYVIIICAVFAALFSGCGAVPAAPADDGKLSVVATIFPAYDFARQVVGDNGSVTMLIPPGSEIHSYEPTPQDIMKISSCDIFIYNGGESDEWVDDVLSSIEGKVTVIRMTDCVTQVEEEAKEGMYVSEDKSEAGQPEYDEHVWTSPVNAQKICAAIADAAAERDPAHADAYKKNLAAYTDELSALDKSFRDVVGSAKRKTLIFADRFPARYFTEEYGLDYFAAYPGCAEEAEPSAQTVAFLINKVREDGAPCVLYIEFSNQKMADTICGDTGCAKLEFNSCHNVSKADFENGVTYLELMQKNVETLRKALN